MTKGRNKLARTMSLDRKRVKPQQAAARVAQKPDGRRLRTEDSRQRIVAAMLALVREGSVAPNAEDVAARAGAGLRTVFRLFDNMDGLYREMNAAMEREVMPLVLKPLEPGPWRKQLEELLGRRAEVYEQIMPVKIASDAQQHTSVYLRNTAKRLVVMQRGGLLAVLPPDIVKDQARFEAINLVMSFEAWRRLRNEQGLSIKRAREAVTLAVKGLIG